MSKATQPLRTLDVATTLAHLGSWSRGTGPLYQQLARAFSAAIERGDIVGGTRLPAERSLAQALAVSRGTVMAAYSYLREHGWAESRQGSGTWIRLDFARTLETMNDQPSSRSRRLSGRLLEDTEGVIDLTISAMSSLDDVPEELLRIPPRRSVERLSGGHGYLPLGLLGLRHRVSAYYAQRSLPTELPQVAVTGGAQQAISLIANLMLRPGDAVVIESPSYPGAVDVFSRAGARLISIPPTATSPSLAELRAAIAANAPRLVYLMPACHNPTGQTTRESRRREIALLADQHPLYIIEDNILSDVVFAGSGGKPVAAHSRSGRVLTLGSLSKVAWGGLRVGWVRGPAELIDRLGRLKAATDFGTSIPSQVMACGALDMLDSIGASRRARLREYSATLEKSLRSLLPSWKWPPPEGGLTLWATLPFGDADSFNQHAVRHGVDFTPGSVHSADDANTECLRLSFAKAPAVLEEGVSRLTRAWDTYTRSRAVAMGAVAIRHGT